MSVELIDPRGVHSAVAEWSCMVDQVAQVNTQIVQVSVASVAKAHLQHSASGRGYRSCLPQLTLD